MPTFENNVCVKFDSRQRKKFPMKLTFCLKLTQQEGKILHLLRENLLLYCCCCRSAWKFDSCALTRSCQVDKAALPLLFWTVFVKLTKTVKTSKQAALKLLKISRVKVQKQVKCPLLLRTKKWILRLCNKASLKSNID